MKLGTGKPTAPGVYAARIWYGWRVLEWDGGRWMHQGCHASWPESVEVETWAGPLPAGEYPQPAPAKRAPLPIKAPMEYDL